MEGDDYLCEIRNLDHENDLECTVSIINANGEVMGSITKIITGGATEEFSISDIDWTGVNDGEECTLKVSGPKEEESIAIDSTASVESGSSSNVSLTLTGELTAEELAITVTQPLDGVSANIINDNTITVTAESTAKSGTFKFIVNNNDGTITSNECEVTVSSKQVANVATIYGDDVLKSLTQKGVYMADVVAQIDDSNPDISFTYDSSASDLTITIGVYNSKNQLIQQGDVIFKKHTHGEEQGDAHFNFTAFDKITDLEDEGGYYSGEIYLKDITK